MQTEPLRAMRVRSKLAIWGTATFYLLSSLSSHFVLLELREIAKAESMVATDRTALAIVFHPANDNPRKRPEASLHEAGRVVDNASSRSFALVVEKTPAAPQLLGPGQKPHSTPE